MKRMMFTLMMLVGTVSALGVEDHTPPSLQDRTINFLMKNVMGRTQLVTTEGTVEHEGAKYAIKFQAHVTWNNLKRTQDGLVFDQVRQIKQSNTTLDASGKPTAKVTRTDRTVIMRYALTERVTTNSLVGVATMVKNTLEDPTGRANTAMIELRRDGQELYLYESQVGFSEASLDGKNISPIATASDATLFIGRGGQLMMYETLKFYKVNVNKDFAREEINRFNLNAVQVRP